ncbi:MAG: cyclic nucleotide-binding domain-containing protein [Chloroflexi bacterium]|nr:cyclic nucleotide-binding domain-containing protein [Chloroflexota bacterium]
MTYQPSPESPLSNFTNSLPEETRRAVLASATCREYRADEIICPHGAPAEALYFVLTGNVHLDFPQWRMRHILADGESFGESEIIRRAVNPFTAVAITDVELWVLEKCALDSLLENHSALSLALSHRIVAKYQTMQTVSLQASRRYRRKHRPADYKIAFGALAMVILTAMFFSLVLVVFTATTLQVEGLEFAAGTSESDAPAVPASPTKVARWLGLPEPTRTPIALTATATRSPTRTATSKPVATRTPRLQPTPTATLVAPAMAAVMAAPTPLPREWKMPAWTIVEDAQVAPGQKYFRLVKAIYFDEASAGGRVNILVGVLDENGKELIDVPVRMEWGVNEYTIRQTEEKRDPFLIPYNLNIIAAHDMAGGSSFAPERGERGGYKITIEGFASDAVSGMGLPLRRHVAFLLVFQRTVR